MVVRSSLKKKIASCIIYVYQLTSPPRCDARNGWAQLVQLRYLARRGSLEHIVGVILQVRVLVIIFSESRDETIGRLVHCYFALLGSL